MGAPEKIYLQEPTKVRTQKIYDNDLFNFAIQENKNKIAKTKKEIEMLENGTYPIPEFPEYINEIKKWIRKNYEKDTTMLAMGGCRHW